MVRTSKLATATVAVLLLLTLSAPPGGTQDSSVARVSIPGVSDKYGSEKTIKALLDVEKTKLTRLEGELETYQSQKKAWQDLSREFASLRDRAKSLYGFQNPFQSHIASSSDEAVLTGTANRQSTEQEHSFVVKELAQADRFLSRPLPKTFQVEPGEYILQLGEEKRTLQFGGGSLQSLASAINKRAPELVKASVVSDTAQTQVFLLESLKTGAANRLVFDGQLALFAVKAGVVESTGQGPREIGVNRYAVAPWSRPLSEVAFLVEDGALTLKPLAELKLPVSPALPLTPDMVLEAEVWVEKLPEAPYKPPEPPSGPAIPTAGGIDFQGIRVENERSQTLLPSWQAPQAPQKVSDSRFLYVGSRGSALPLSEIPDSDGYRRVRFDIGQLAGEIESLNFRNANTFRVLHVRKLVLFDKTIRGEYRPLNALSEARDALVLMDGIEVKRPSNLIDDLIPGVTLTFRKESKDPVSLKVARDIELIKKQILSFIGTYDRALVLVDVVSRQDATILSDAQFLTEDERKSLEDRQGLLTGDMTLARLKSGLQTRMMEPYPTRGAQEMALLAQIGIATDTRNPGSAGLDRTRLRGYLEIEDGQLGKALDQHPDWVGDLFGRDTDGDLVVDSGVGYVLDTLLASYVGRAGAISGRIDTIDGSISRKNREIEAFKKHLKEYETELRRKFGAMEGSLESLDKSSSALDNLNKNK